MVLARKKKRLFGRDELVGPIRRRVSRRAPRRLFLFCVARHAARRLPSSSACSGGEGGRGEGGGETNCDFSFCFLRFGSRPSELSRTFCRVARRCEFVCACSSAESEREERGEGYRWRKSTRFGSTCMRWRGCGTQSSAATKQKVRKNAGQAVCRRRTLRNGGEKETTIEPESNGAEDHSLASSSNQSGLQRNCFRDKGSWSYRESPHSRAAPTPLQLT